MNSISFITSSPYYNYKKSSVASHPVNKNISFKGDETKYDLTKFQVIAPQNYKVETNKQQFSESDINFSYTCQGYRELDGNTRHVNDFERFDWYREGRHIKVLYNRNGDERYNGHSTRLMFPLPVNTEGLRNGDNMSVLINGLVSKEDVEKLIKKMDEYGVNFDFRGYNTSSGGSRNQPILRKNIAILLNQIQKEKQTAKVEETNAVEDTKPAVKYNISANDINMLESGHIQSKGNSREVKDYLREFMTTGKKRTIIHDKFTTPDGEEKDSTVLLFPQGEWDYAAISIDANIPVKTFENAIHHVSSQNIKDTDDERFKPVLIDYLNNL